MNNFLLIDSSHLFHRARHVITRGTDSEKVGMCLHLLFSSLQKAWRTQGANHIVFAFDGRSWRKDVYAPYKYKRKEAKTNESLTEQAESQMFYDAFDEFKKFVSTRSNCTILDNPTLEADDLISGFIQIHPNDNHIIVSSDGDFEQLLAKNVSIYNGIQDQTITVEGIFDWKGNRVKDKKTGELKKAPDPKWSVFEKCVRGCISDNIFSAYPGIRTKGSKNKAGLLEAFNDRLKQGFDWSSVMMTRWTDPKGVEHKVFDDYLRNKGLVDLTEQPEHIRKLISDTVSAACVPLNRSQIGIYFLKLCGKYELVKISEQAKNFTDLLNSPYPCN